MKLTTGGLAGLAEKTLTSTRLASLLLTTALIFNENELIDNPICNNYREKTNFIEINLFS